MLPDTCLYVPIDEKVLCSIANNPHSKELFRSLSVEQLQDVLLDPFQSGVSGTLFLVR